MTGADVLKYNVLQNVFSPFNSWLINKNANHQLLYYQVGLPVHFMKVKVRVTNSSGQPVSGAMVSSWGTINNNNVWNTPQSLLEMLTTNADGLVTLTNDFYAPGYCTVGYFGGLNSCWYVKMIKASSGSLLGGAALTALDLQMAYWMHDQDDYILTVVIQ